MKNKSLPENPTLRNLREWRGLTQKELAKRANISDSVLGYYELGKTIPTADKLAAIARELNVSVKTLMRSLGISCEGIPDDIPTRKNYEDE